MARVFNLRRILLWLVYVVGIFLLINIIPTVIAKPLEGHNLGVNYGTLGNNLPNPHNVIGKIKSMKIGKVKIFTPDHTILSALAHSGLEVVVGVSNDDIENLASSKDAADKWIQENIAPNYPKTNIVTIVMGNEVFRQSSLQSIWGSVVPAMQNIHDSLDERGWSDAIKLSTSVTLEVLQAPYPPLSLPSRASFRQDLLASVILPLLRFLQSTDSYLFMNVHPIFSYWQNYPRISLDYALLDDSSHTSDDGHVYTNILDEQLDAMNSAMSKLGFEDVRIAISESGWPTKGDSNQMGAPNITNAQTYNQRLVKKVLSGGTPMHPKRFIPTFIFSLFNENQKSGPTSEKNWGLLDAHGNSVYKIDLSGQHVYNDNDLINL